MNNTPLIISFSGGRSSAYMCHMLQKHYPEMPKAFVFANTGKEREETLEFVDECDKRMGLNLVWIEAVINQEKGVGVSYRIVDFKTASRKGEPFEAMIRKFGIPNKDYPHCNRELKIYPIGKYCKELMGGGANIIRLSAFALMKLAGQTERIAQRSIRSLTGFRPGKCRFGIFGQAKTTTFS